MALGLNVLSTSTSINLGIGTTVSSIPNVATSLSTAIVLSASTSSGSGISSSSSIALLPSVVQSIVNNLTSTSASAVTDPSSIFSGLEVQVPGLPLGVGFPFLVENITPPRVNSSLFDQFFKSLRLAWSPELLALNNTGTDTAPNFDTSNLPLLDAGQPFTLLTALPQPGTVISLPPQSNSTSPTSSASSAATSTSTSTNQPTPTPNGFAGNTLFTIPENAFITSKWDFYKKDSNADSFVPVSRTDYKILNGSLFATSSGSSQYVFNPAPAFDDTIRSIVGCLNTTIFIPDGSNKNLVAPRICLGAKVNSWRSHFGNISSDGVITGYAGTKGLFHLDVDTTTPLPGNPVTLLVNPVDKMPLLAPRVDTIVDAAPDLKVTAAVDLGAPLNAVIGAGVKAITGLFNPGAADKVSSGVLSVAGVLDGLLSVPIALDFQGRSVTKTLKPTADMITQNVLSLAGGLAGTLPIGSLVATISSTADNITLPTPPQTPFIQQTLDGLHGLTLNFLPNFTAAGTPGLPDRLTIPVTLRPSIVLPGMDQPLINEIDLGTITVTLPRISLPQVAMLFHDAGFLTTSANDILLVADPATFRLAASVNEIRVLLEQLNTVLIQVRNIFRGLIPGDVTADLDDLTNTVSTMLNFIEIAPTDPTQSGYIKLKNVNVPGAGSYMLGSYGDTFSGKAALSSLMWIGLPSVYRFYVGLPSGTLYFGNQPGNSYSGAIFDADHQMDSSGICFQDKGVGACQDFNKDSNGASQFNDNAQKLWFRKL